MTRTIGKQPSRKTKKSFTLSQDSADFLETMRKQRQAHSVSAVLEEILQAVRREQRRAALESAVADYYTTLSTEEVDEQKNWGELGLLEFPREGA